MITIPIAAFVLLIVFAAPTALFLLVVLGAVCVGLIDSIADGRDL